MKYLKIISLTMLLFATASTELMAQQDDCSKFKTGKFIIPGTSNSEPDIHIKRTKKYQIEQAEGTKEKIKLRIVWLDECTYQLEYAKKYEGRLPEGTIITGKIYNVDGNTCDVTVSTNIANLPKMELKMKKVS